MTRNTKATKTAKTSKARLKIGKLKLNKETVKDLTSAESRKVKGGQKPEAPTGNQPSYSCGGTCGMACH
jgi:hypothetical protein